MILGANGNPLATTAAQAEAEANAKRLQALMKKIEAVFVEEQCTFQDGATIGGNLMINFITTAGDAVTAKQIADQLYRQFGEAIRQTLANMVLTDQVKSRMQDAAANTPEMPS